MPGVGIRQMADSEGQRGSRSGQVGWLTPPYRASWSTVVWHLSGVSPSQYSSKAVTHPGTNHHVCCLTTCFTMKADFHSQAIEVIYIPIKARENRKNSRSGPKLRILDRFQTPQNANKSVQQVCALNPIFAQPTNFHESMMSKKSQTVKSSQTDNVRAPFKCDIMVVKRL